MFNSIPAPGAGSSGPAVDETARAAAAAAMDQRISAPLLSGQMLVPHGASVGNDIWQNFSPPSGGDNGGDSVFFSPIYIPAGMTLGTAVCYIFPGYSGSPHFRMAIYDTGPDGRPATRVWQSGSLPVVSHGFAIVEISPAVTISGWHWVTVVGDTGFVSFGNLDSSPPDRISYAESHFRATPSSVRWRPNYVWDGYYWNYDWENSTPFSVDVLPSSLEWPETHPDYQDQTTTPFVFAASAETAVSPLAVFLGE